MRHLHTALPISPETGEVDVMVSRAKKRRNGIHAVPFRLLLGLDDGCEQLFLPLTTAMPPSLPLTVTLDNYHHHRRRRHHRPPTTHHHHLRHAGDLLQHGLVLRNQRGGRGLDLDGAEVPTDPEPAGVFVG